MSIFNDEKIGPIDGFNDAFRKIDACADIAQTLEKSLRDLGAKVAAGESSYPAIFSAQCISATVCSMIVDRLATAALYVIVMEGENHGNK